MELRLRFVQYGVLFCCLALCASAQVKPAATPPPVPYDNEAMVVEQYETAIRYNTDGTGERNLHLRVKLQTEAGTRQFSVLSFSFAAANETAKLQSLTVHHPDGTSTETPASDAIEMPAPVTQQAPLYSDLKVLQVPVRGLRTGDILEYRLHVQIKNPESPSQFWGNFSFLKEGVVLAQNFTLDLPAGKYVQVWSPTLHSATTDSAGRHVYVWTSSQLKPTTQKKDDSEAPAPDTKPDVGWTTFHTWQEVGEWYRALAATRALPTDALRAQADEITREAKTPVEQIQALYTFVATRIRYVGVDFGVGRYQPHAAAEVLANQYGDCKDKDTLLESLLHAKGFMTAPAAIGMNIDMVPDLPSPALFNHVITTVTLPAGRLWMDATPEVAPFQLLLAPLRDKEALVIPASGAATLERTPASAPYPFLDRFEAVATLKADGDLTGHVDINYRSDNEFVLRTIARSIAPAQWDQGSQYLANALGFSGTTSNTTFARAEDLSVPMHLSYDYAKKPFGDWDSFRIVPLFPVLTLPVAPDKKPSAEIDLGAVRTENSISRIHLPEGFSSDLPDAVHIKTPFATFDKTYALRDGVLTAEKTLVILASKLPAAQWEKYKAFTTAISLGEIETWIQLTSTGSVAAKGPHPPKPGEDNPAASRLVAETSDLERNRDWAGALSKLDEARKISPEQPYLWSNYGYIAIMQNKPEEGDKYYRHELEHHPDESYVVRQFASFLRFQKQDEEARSVLAKYFQTDPSVEGVALQLADLQSRSSLPDAIATLRKAAAVETDRHVVRTQLAEYLHRNHEDTEAAALAKEQLADASEPYDLNAGAYLLAETKTELPLAEQKTRLALDKLGTAATPIEESNSQSTQKTSLLVAIWDTLGFILLEQNRLDEAHDYLQAAWANLPEATTGDHFGTLQEAMGDSKAALHTYELARTAHGPQDSEPEIKAIDASIARLRQAGVVSTVKPDLPDSKKFHGIPISSGNGSQSLQDQRTFKLSVKSATNSYRSAVYRLQVTSKSTPAVLRLSGEASLDDAVEPIKQLPLSHLVPTLSPATILREAVLSCSPHKTECELVLIPLGLFTPTLPSQ